MRFSTAVLVLLTVTLCSGFAFATNQRRIDIPFVFSIEGRPFPPGIYEISIDGNIGSICLTNKDAPEKSVRAVTKPADPVATTDPTVLRFRVDSPSYSLENIQMGRRSASLPIMKLKRATMLSTTQRVE